MNEVIQRLTEFRKSWTGRRLVAFLCALLMLCTSVLKDLPARVAGFEAEGGEVPVCGIPEHRHTEGCYEVPVTRELACPREGSRDVVLHWHDRSCYENGRLICPLPSCEGDFVEAGGEVFFESEMSSLFGAELSTFGEGLSLPLSREAVLVSTEGTYSTYQDPAIDGLLVYDGDKLLPHTHGPSCYDRKGNLTCSLAQAVFHQHGEECYREVKGEPVLTCSLQEHTHTLACYEGHGEEMESVFLPKV